MPSLLTCIKKAAVEAVAEADPCAVYFGRVESVVPLCVMIDERYFLEENQLIMTAGAADIKAGSDVVLFRIQGGQKYVLFDVVL
jgi:hypothetical protein